MNSLNCIFKDKLAPVEIADLKDALRIATESEYFINKETGEEINILENSTKKIIKIINNKYTPEEIEQIVNSLFQEENDIYLRRILTEKEVEILKQILLWHQQEIKTVFDGKLKPEELQKLKVNPKISEKQIEKIEDYLENNKDYLSGFSDIVGDTGVPSKLFFLLFEKFSYLLQNDPESLFTEKGVQIRRKLHFLIKMIGPAFLKNPQVIENRNYLKAEHPEEEIILPDPGIVLPKEPVIWTANHGFKDDILATILAAPRHTYLVLASLPQFFNTFDGLTAYLNGVVLFNRKVQSSRESLLPKGSKVMNLGADLLLFGEGVHNKTPNEILIEIWPGIYRLAKEKGSYISPIIHYIKDPTCKMPFNPIHTVIDDPIRIDDLSEKAGLELLRDIMATWWQLMNEKYGNMTREELLFWYTNRALEYNKNLTLENLYNKHLTTAEAFGLFLLDLNSTVDRYDSEIERNADFRSKTIVRPEDAFLNIANIKNSNAKNIRNILEASKLVRERKFEDYQRRF